MFLCISACVCVWVCTDTATLGLYIAYNAYRPPLSSKDLTSTILVEINKKLLCFAFLCVIWLCLTCLSSFVRRERMLLLSRAGEIVKEEKEGNLRFQGTVALKIKWQKCHLTPSQRSFQYLPFSHPLPYRKTVWPVKTDRPSKPSLQTIHWQTASLFFFF